MQEPSSELNLEIHEGIFKALFVAWDIHVEFKKKISLTVSTKQQIKSVLHLNNLNFLWKSMRCKIWNHDFEKQLIHVALLYVFMTISVWA